MTTSFLKTLEICLILVTFRYNKAKKTAIIIFRVFNPTMNIQFTPQINQQKIYNNRPAAYQSVSFKGLDSDRLELSDVKPNKKNNFWDTLKNCLKLKSNEEIFEDNLRELGFSDEWIKNTRRYIDLDLIESKECLLSMTKDVPNIESEALRSQYVFNRMHASCVPDIKTGKYNFNKKAFDTFNNIYAKNPSLHNPNCLNLLCTVITKNNLYDNNLDFLNSYLDDDKNAALYLLSFAEQSMHTIYEKDDDFKNLKALSKMNCDKGYLIFSFKNKEYPFDEHIDETISRMKEHAEKGVSTRFLIPVLENNLNYEDTKSLCDFVDEVAQSKQLVVDGEPVSDSDLIELFLSEGNGKNTLRTIDIFGKDNFKNMFSEGIDRLEDYIANVGNPELDMKELQPLIKLVNPTGSDEYKTLEKQVSDLKQQLRGVSDESARQELIKKINEFSKEKNSIIKNSIKDPVDRGNAAMIFVGLINDKKTGKEKYKYAHEIAPFLNPKTKEEKTQTNNKLNDLIWKSLEIDCPEEIRDKFDFSKSKYLKKLFCPNEDFSDNFGGLVKIIKKYKQKNVANALDMLPQNVALKETFDEFGLNYKKWTRFDPNLKLDIKVDYDNEKMQQNAITNLESEFNDEFFKSLPDKQKDKIRETLAEGRYQLVEKSEADFVDDGFYNGTKTVNRFYKDDKPIEFKDLSNIYKLLDKEFCNNEYWDFDQSSDEIENSKGTFKDHIKSRHEEMKRIRQAKGCDSSTITIQKADMNDISHALFLGNDACCCTAIGSFNDWSAPNYIKNKMVQAIELKDGDKYIGNTMIYFAAIDERPAIFLDNIELKPKYQYNDTIEQGIIDFAKMLGRAIGCQDIDIYAGPNRHKLNMKNFELVDKEFQFVGSTGEDSIYFDAISDEVKLDYSTLEGTIYKLKD